MFFASSKKLGTKPHSRARLLGAGCGSCHGGGSDSRRGLRPVGCLPGGPAADGPDRGRPGKPPRRRPRARVRGESASRAVEGLRHPLVVAHPPGRPYRERLLKLAALAAERDGLAVDDGLAEAHAEALCEQRASDQWCHKTFVLDVEPPRGEEHLPAARWVFVDVARAHHRARFPEPVRGRDGVPRVGGRVFSRRAGREPRRRTLRGQALVEIGPGVGVAATALELFDYVRRPPR